MSLVSGNVMPPPNFETAAQRNAREEELAPRKKRYACSKTLKPNMNGIVRRRSTVISKASILGKLMQCGKPSGRRTKENTKTSG